MNALDKAKLLLHMVKWRLTWDWRDTRKAVTVPGNPRFMSARDAIRLIDDGAVVAVSGLGANQRASILYWALRELFEEEGHPRNLTFMVIGGHGGRGRAPGTVEEVGQDGLTTRFVSGHLETFKSILKLADAGKCELQCLPQGIMAFLIDAQARGETSLVTETGVNTFMDPRVGRGSPVLEGVGEQLVSVEDGKLRYTMPKIEAAMFNVPAADRKGNLYIKNCAMFGESRDIAHAAKKNGGKVIANVGLLVEEGYDEVFLPAEMVDAVVVFDRTEQTGSIYHKKYWPLFTTNSDMTPDEGAEYLRFVNRILGFTPRRTPADDALARLAVQTITECVAPEAFVNVGIGLPEEVCRHMAQCGCVNEIRLFAESGLIGGLPASGIFFGAGICPKEVISSIDLFKRVYENLDASVLGMLQLDSKGNVNVSKRGEGAINYVGPGGFIDFTTNAKNIFFVSSWMAHGRMEVRDGQLHLAERGKPKFLEAVDEITFNGQEMLKKGKRIFYITHVGLFRLTERGVVLEQVMPGIDIQKDILDFAPMTILLPEDGKVPVVPEHVVTGKDFHPRFGK